MDLTRHSTIFPLDLRAFATFDIDGLILLIANIAIRRLQFTQVVLSGYQLIINVDVAVLIRRVFADRVLPRIIEYELDTINACTSRCIDLVDHDRGHALVGDLYRCGLAILDAGIDGCGIECVSVFRFALNNGVPATLCVRNTDDTIAVCGVGAEDLTVDLANLKLDTTESLSGVLIGLDDLQSAGRDVVDNQRLKVGRIDHNRLTSCILINCVALNCFYFCRNERANNTSNEDLTICVGHIKAVGRELTTLICHKAAVTVGDAELNPFQWLLRDAIKLDDSKPTERLVTELERCDFIGFDFDCLRGVIKDIAILGTRFFDDKRRARCNVGNGESTSAVRHEFAVGVADEIAVRIRNKELYI